MKKVLIAISFCIVVVISFTLGVSLGRKDAYKNVDISKVENSEISGDENSIEKGEKQNEALTEEALIEKYKLSDEYICDEDSYLEEFWNILSIKGLIADELEVESDGMMHKIEIAYKESFDIYDLKYNKYEFKINGEVPIFDNLKVINDYEHVLAVIDLDENDEYKEIVLQQSEGLWVSNFVYRIKKDGLEKITSLSEGMLEINNKFIVPKYNYDVKEKLVEGYYMYENGNFKYIDRFLTGEKIKDVEGNYTENFRNQIFTGGCEGSCYLYARYQGDFVVVGGKVKLLKEVSFVDEDGHTRRYYHCEVLEDLSSEEGHVYCLTEGDFKIPAGTILTD